MDRRRYGVIEVERSGGECYALTINGELWAEVEWSRSRKAWCVQDAAGHCLTHVEHIVGQDRDPQAAIRLAKRMIVDGRMPSPEVARAQLRAEQERVQERVQERMRPKTLANKQITNKQLTNTQQTDQQLNKHQTNKNKRKKEPRTARRVDRRRHHCKSVGSRAGSRRRKLETLKTESPLLSDDDVRHMQSGRFK